MSEKNHIYAANLEAFAARCPGMAAFVDSLDAGAYRTFMAASGDAALEVTLKSGGKLIVGGAGDPRAEARALVPGLSGDARMFIVMGMGLGSLLFETLERYPGSRVIVVEQDARLFKSALGVADWRGVFDNPNVDFIVAVKPERLLKPFCAIFARGDNDTYLPSVRVIKDDRVVALSKEYYAAVSLAFKRATEHYWEVYVGDGYLDALCGLKHVLTNLKSLNRMIDPEHYAGAFAGATGIVVSSGPSLEDKYDFLRRVQDRVPIVCADSALRKLLDNGIKPFGAACVERVEANAKLFFGYDIPDDVTLFAPLVIRPEVVESYPGPICGLYRQAYPFPSLPPLLPRWDMGLSCSHLAYKALRHLGCARVALVGQDLAYDRESGASHFVGADEVLKGPFATVKRPLAADNCGTSIPTSPVWIQFRDIFEDFIAQDRGQAEVVNVIAAEQGLAIAGAKRVDTAEFFATIPKASPLVPFDPSIGRESLCGRTEEFRRAFAARREDVLSLLPGFAHAWSGLAGAPAAADYFERKKRALEILDPPTRYLFEDLIKPHVKRFEAHAVSLWNDAEFRDALPGFVELGAKIIGDLEAAWREG